MKCIVRIICRSIYAFALAVLNPGFLWAEVSVIWSEGFEGSALPSGWTNEGTVQSPGVWRPGTQWEIGVPTSGPDEVDGCRARSGTRCAATILSGDYHDDFTSRLSTPWFVVPAADSDPRVRFWHWWNFSLLDTGSVIIDTLNGSDGRRLSPRFEVDSSGRWTMATLNIGAYAGETVRIIFQSVTQSTWVFTGQSPFPYYQIRHVASGWYIDDVELITGRESIFQALESFESSEVLDRWTVDMGIWEIGTPTSGPAEKNGSRAHDGAACLATILSGNYTDGRTSRVVSVPFVVPAATASPRLRFWHWFDFNDSEHRSLDRGCVQVSSDGGGSWVDLSGGYTGTCGNIWSRASLDLMAYAGKEVRVAFNFESHRAANGDEGVACGWYIDEVTIETGSRAPQQPNVIESFEDGLGDWVVERGAWEVGSPSSGPPQVDGSRAHDGTRCAATALVGDYKDGSGGRLVSTPLVVPEAGLSPRLRFWQWWSFGDGDHGMVQIRVGSGDWQTLSAGPRGSSNGRWSRAWLSLAAFAGHEVEVAFNFHSEDVNGVENVSSGWYVDQVVVETGPLNPMPAVEDFEAGWGGWLGDYLYEGGTATDYAIWEIGLPEAGPAIRAGSRAHSGKSCAATVLSGNFPQLGSSRLVSPVFTVPSAEEFPRLRFWHWYDFGESAWGRVQLTTDGGGRWIDLLTLYPGTDVHVWTRPSVDLRLYAGQEIQIGYNFSSFREGSVGAGWYVDEVAVVAGLPSTLQPNIPEGFEEGLGDWSVNTGAWEVGTPISGPDEVAGRRTHEGSKCIMAGGYGSSGSSRLVSAPFRVPMAEDKPRLRFWHWFDFEGGASGCVQVSIDGGLSWMPLSQEYSGTSRGSWTCSSFDLTRFAGETVQVGFQFLSSGSTGEPLGWYVDEVAVTSGLGVTRLINVSTRGNSGNAESVLISGFVVSGEESRRILIRAIGPALAGFGVEDVMADPQITLMHRIGEGWRTLATNDDWGTQSDGGAIDVDLASAARRVGAFEIPSGSSDAALLLDLEPGSYSVFSAGTSGSVGAVLVELYDVDETSASCYMINYSSRGYVGYGNQPLITGLVVSDEGPNTFLVRAAGPALAVHGVREVLPDPEIAIYRRRQDPLSADMCILRNDNWSERSDADHIVQLGRQLGAFALPHGSRDSAAVVALQSGIYTIVVGSSDGNKGNVLVEVYVVPSSLIP